MNTVDEKESPVEKGFLGNRGSFDSHVPACMLFCCDEGSATLVMLEQSSFSLERGHSRPPAASNRLSLENSVGCERETEDEEKYGEMQLNR